MPRVLLEPHGSRAASGSRRAGKTLYAPRLNVRPVSRVAPSRVSDLIRPGDTPARPGRHQVFQELRPRSIRAVARGLGFVHLKTELPVESAMPRGLQHPFRERANIERRPPNAYGSSFGLYGEPAPYPTQLLPAPAL